MYKAKQRMKTLLLACFAALVSMLLAVALWVTPTSKIDASAAESTETISVFGSTGTLAADNSSISWSGEYFTFTNTKGSTAIRTSDSDHYRVYANSTINISVNEGMTITKIVITCTSSSYATVCQTSFNNEQSGSATVSGSTVTITPTDSPTSVTATASAQTRFKTVAITYTEASSEPTCEHTNTTTATVEATCTEAGSITVTCDDCRETVSTTEIPATGHVNTTTTTVDATCTVAGSTTVSCDDCGETVSTEEIPALGHNIENGEPVNNENGTHSTTGVCSRCGEEETVTVPCEYEKANNENDVTYTCTICGYNYSVEKYTITYVVPDGIEAINEAKAEANSTIPLEVAGTIEGYTFVGWVTEELAEKTEDIPVYFTEYTVTEDINFYALYSYAEGTGAWTLVTDAATLAIDKQIVIVSKDENYAMGADKGNNRAAVDVTKANDTVTWTTDVQIITLEAGTVVNTFAFNVGNGYLYAASTTKNYLKTQTTNDANGSWNISISEGKTTITAPNSSNRNLLQYNPNNGNPLFSCYASAQKDVSIYMKDSATYYVTEFNTCAHTNTDEVIEEATCTESGSRTVTCLDCDSVIEAEILPALGHNYIDGICDNCGEQDPKAIVYDGYYYLILNNKYAGEKDGNYYKLFDFTPNESIELNYVFYFVKNGETYDMYNVKDGLIAKNLTIETQDDYSVRIKNSDGKILSHNTGYTTYQRMGFYATSSSYPAAITLTAVELANIDSASVTLGSDVKLNYYADVSDVFENVEMQYYVVGNESEIFTAVGEKVDGRWKFTLNVAPQAMTEVFSASIVSNGLVLDTIQEYSVQKYAINQLANSPSDELKQLLTDMLHYGAAAQNYKGYNTESLATTGVDNIGTASDVRPGEECKSSLTTTKDLESYPAYFTGATVWFDGINKLRVYITTIDGASLSNVSLTINGEAVAVSGNMIETDGILATQFGETYTFVLSYDGTVMQTLTYSVNAYAHAKKDDAEMGELALALYRYGVSADLYKKYLATLA